ncbi:hypothetical protein CCR94_03330, partial [Rhodoblastus sphagnicola]
MHPYAFKITRIGRGNRQSGPERPVSAHGGQYEVFVLGRRPGRRAASKARRRAAWSAGGRAAGKARRPSSW